MNVSLEFIPLFYFFYNVVYASFSFPSGRFSDKMGRRFTLSIGYLLWILTSFCFFISSNYLFAIIGMFLYGITSAIIETISRTIIADLSSLKVRGKFYGYFHFFIGIIALPSSFIAGSIGDKFGTAYIFLFSGTCGIISLVSLFILHLKIDKPLK